MHKHIDWNGVKGYATYENAMKKLMKEVSKDDSVRTMIAVNDQGRFIPVAFGEQAMQLGLHFRGICVA